MRSNRPPHEYGPGPFCADLHTQESYVALRAGRRDARPGAGSSEETPIAFKLSKAVGRFLLEDAAIGHIDFFVGRTDRLHVDEQRLRYVGRLIETERMGVKTSDLQKENYSAFYDPEWQKFEFDTTLFYSSWNGSRKQRLKLRSLIIHEAVHAVIDLNRRRVFEMRGEAAGYLAAAVYLHHHGAVQEVMQVASELYRDILATSDHIAKRRGLYDEKGVHLTRSHIAPLLRLLRNTPPYDEGIRLLDRTKSNSFDHPFLRYR